MRPAVNVGISVSRVGGNAQRKGMKKIAGSLRLDLASFRALEAFAQLGTELDDATQRQLDRGARMVELLKQPQYTPYAFAHQVVSIYAGTKGLLDDLEVAQVLSFEAELLKHLDDEFPEIIEAIEDAGVISSEVESQLVEIIGNFKTTFRQQHAA